MQQCLRPFATHSPWEGEARGLPHSGILLSDLHHSLKVEDQRAGEAWGKQSANSVSPRHMMTASPSPEPASVSSQERQWDPAPRASNCESGPQVPALLSPALPWGPKVTLGPSWLSSPHPITSQVPWKIPGTRFQAEVDPWQKVAAGVS